MPRLAVCVLLFLCHLLPDADSRMIECPEECTCHQINDAATSDCSSSSLTSLPEDLDNFTLVLDISNNFISTLPDNAFIELGVHLLQSIDLNNNELKDISPLSFHGLQHLRELSLQGNSIRYLSAINFTDNYNFKLLDISINELSSLPNVTSETLEELYLHNNEITSVDFSILFSLFPSLIKLDLSMNRIGDLSDSRDYNGTYFSSLKVLDLSNNKIYKFDKGVFRRFTNLVSLNMSHNGLKFFNDIPHFKDMIKLETLDLSFNRIRYLHQNLFENIFELEYLILNSNNISFLHQDTFKTLFRLRILEMQHNDLTYIHKDILTNKPYLQEVNFGYNGLNIISNDTFSGNPILVKLNLCGCESCSRGIKYIIPGTLFGKYNLVELDLSKNKLSKLDPETFHGNPSLETLHLNHNRLKALPEEIFETNLRLYSLYIQNNLIETLHPNTFTRNNELRHIDISSNLISTLDPNMFSNKKFLHSLILNHNKLIFNNSILNSDSLEILDISFCNISSLPTESFINLPNLQKLLLNNNELKYVRNDVFNVIQNPEDDDNEDLQVRKPLKNLQLLDLSRNHIESMDVGVLCDKTYLVELYIAGNPLICNCMLANVWKWSQKHHLEIMATCNNSYTDWGNVKSLNCIDVKYPCLDVKDNSQITIPHPRKSMHFILTHFYSYVITYVLLSSVVILIVIGWIFPLLCRKKETSKTARLDGTFHMEEDNTINHDEFLLYPQVYGK
ncbi:insulin-like growth factor-binding protein complex acid labile subunit isoform X2 [Periplaneta americana]